MWHPKLRQGWRSMTYLQCLGAVRPLRLTGLRGLAPHAPKPVSVSARVCLCNQHDKELPSLHAAQGKSPFQPNHQTGWFNDTWIQSPTWIKSFFGKGAKCSRLYAFTSIKSPGDEVLTPCDLITRVMFWSSSWPLRTRVIKSQQKHSAWSNDTCGRYHMLYTMIVYVALIQ